MISEFIREQVIERANGRCEYCLLHQNDSDFLSFHVEHIIARQHGGLISVDNLCLACAECNWAKGPNLAGMVNGKIYSLFNPRKQFWKRHFYWDGTLLIGKTLTGQATISVLNINEMSRVILREQLKIEGRFPQMS
jgi:HNH endonuclease